MRSVLFYHFLMFESINKISPNRQTVLSFQHPCNMIFDYFLLFRKCVSLNKSYCWNRNAITPNRLQACWWQVDVGDIILVTIFGCWWRKKDVGDIFWDVGDYIIGHQHHKTKKYDVGDRFRMLETLNGSWWRFFVCWCQLKSKYL